MPMLSGTATTVAAFFPMLFALIGSKQEYIYSLPVTLSVTLGISWVLAMTFCVILAAAFIRAPSDPSKPDAPLPRLMSLFKRRKTGDVASDSGSSLIDRTFGMLASGAIKAKWLTVGVAFMLLIGALLLPVGSEFFPKDLRDQFAIQVWLPETATLEETNRAAREVERILQALSPTTDAEGEPAQQIRAMRTIIGGGGFRWYLSWDPEQSKANYAEILVRTTDPRFTPDLARRVREIATSGDEQLGISPVAGARVVPQELYLGPSSDPVALRVMGNGFADMDQLREIAGRVKEMIRNDPGSWDVNDSWGTDGFELQVDIDPDKANLAGVSNAQVARTLNAYFSGQELTTFREGDHLVPVYLRLLSSERQSIDNVRAAHVEGIQGKVPLESIATVTPRWEPVRIDRRDRNRVIEVTSRVEDGVRGNDVVNRILSSEAMDAVAVGLAGWILDRGRRIARRVAGRFGATGHVTWHFSVADRHVSGYPVQRLVQTSDYSDHAAIGPDRCDSRSVLHRQSAGLHAATRDPVAVRHRAEHGNHLYGIRRPVDRREGNCPQRFRSDRRTYQIRVSRMFGRGGAHATAPDLPDYGNDNWGPAAIGSGWRTVVGRDGMVHDLRFGCRHAAHPAGCACAVRDLRRNASHSARKAFVAD